MPSPRLAHFDDDPELQGEVGLIRRIRPDWVDWTQLDAESKPRISGIAFQLQTQAVAEAKGYPSRCMSFATEREVLLYDESLDVLLVGWEGYGLAKVEASVLRAETFGLQAVPELGEPWHVVAFPLISRSRAKTAQEPLARAAKLIRVPTRQ